jgi:hypothetical protein
MEAQVRTGPLARSARHLRAASGLALISVLVLMLFLSQVPWAGGQYSCPFHELTGYSCLTCGMTRSFAALGDGDISGALHFHPAGPIVLAALSLWGLKLLAEAILGRRLMIVTRRSVRRAAVLAAGFLWAIYGIARVALEMLS